MCGQIAGAYYGVEGIPADWLSELAMRTYIEGKAGELYEARRPGCGDRHPTSAATAAVGLIGPIQAKPREGDEDHHEDIIPF